MSINVAVFSGNIGRDAELKTVKDTELAEFSLAVTNGYGDKKTTSWVRCTIWGKRAKSLEPHLKKGASITVSGEVSTNGYLKKDGTAAAELRLRVDQLEFQGGAKERTSERPDAREPGADDGMDPPFTAMGNAEAGKSAFDL